MPDDRYNAFKLSLGSSSKADVKLDAQELEALPLSFASVSIGCKDEHTLPKKLDAISAAGFHAIELGMPDLVAFANGSRPDHAAITADDYDALCAVGREVRSLCAARNLSILILQPFTRFEGWPEGSDERDDAWGRLEGWMRIMDAVGTDMLQVGASDAPVDRIGHDRDRFVTDLRALADALAARGLRVAYENWCWSTHAPDWEDVWDICQRVDRANFGLCLDTFQSAGGEWGDPSTASGMVQDGRTAEQVEQAWKRSCARLADVVPPDKIFLLQISDAYKPRQPFTPDVVGDEPPRAHWSHDFRPLPFDGYLPLVDFTRAVLKTGFKGWFSYEVFDSGPDGKGNDYELGPRAAKARECQVRLIRACTDEP